MQTKPPKNAPAQTLLKPEEVTRMLNISRATLNKWASEGKVQAVQLGISTRRYRQADIEALIAGCTTPMGG